jgi:hypothetical protein
MEKLALNPPTPKKKGQAYVMIQDKENGLFILFSYSFKPTICY